MVLRWGIASAGLISHDFATALKTDLARPHHKIIGVAARELKRAQEFAKKHEIPQAYGSYEELTKNPDLDIIYVGNTNAQHFDVVSMSLQNGKHVLCEKPLTLNAKQTKTLIALAKEKKLFLMEAIWSRCFPVYEKIRKEISSGNLGDILQVMVTFGCPLESIERLIEPALGGGVTLDLGVYTLQFTTLVMGEIEPEELKATGHCNDAGCDMSVAVALKYSYGRTALLSMSAKGDLPNEAHVIGTKGFIKVPLFWCPNEMTTKNGTEVFPLPTGAKFDFNFDNSEGMAYEAEEVRRCIECGFLESVLVPHSLSVLIAELQDNIRSQLGVKFPDE